MGYHCAMNRTITPTLCLPGGYCMSGSVFPRVCPLGYESNNMTYNRSSIDNSCTICQVSKYSNDGLVCMECPNGTYTDIAGQRSCIDCEAGYVCVHGERLFTPEGYYGSNGKAYPCPWYTYSDTPRVSIQCIASPPGFFINASAVSNIYSYQCPLGHFCPANGTITPTPCPAGTLRLAPGAARIEDCLPCTVGFYCPQQATFTPLPCTNDGYCAAGSTEPSPCPRGYELGETYTGPARVSIATACNVCSPGTFGDGMQCIVCPEGAICASYGMEYPGECSIGHYCNNGSQIETPCPVGTFNNETSSTCKRCTEGTFNHLEGRSACRPCSSSAFSNIGATVCACVGAHRVFQPTDSKCICIPGYVAYSSNDGFLKLTQPDEDGIEDCQPLTYPRCQANEVLTNSGECRSDCEDQCIEGDGVLDGRTGVCDCVGVVALDQVCNETCREENELSSRISGYSLIVQGRAVDLQVIGKIECDGHCDVIGCFVGENGIGCSYDIEKGLRFPHGRNRLLLEETAEVFYQPILCIAKDDYILFNVNNESYVTYKKDSLLNTNPMFDYGQFRQLQHTLRSTNTGSQDRVFPFTFHQPGIYVLAHSNNTALETIVSVHLTRQACPLPGMIVPKSSSALITLGSKKRDQILFEPDWILLVALLGGLFGAVLLMVFLLQCCTLLSRPTGNYRKSAKAIRFDKAIKFQGGDREVMSPRFSDANKATKQALESITRSMKEQDVFLKERLGAQNEVMEELKELISSEGSSVLRRESTHTDFESLIEVKEHTLLDLVVELDGLVVDPPKLSKRAIIAIEEASDSPTLKDIRRLCKQVAYNANGLADVYRVSKHEAKAQAIESLTRLERKCTQLAEEQLHSQEDFIVKHIDRVMYTQVLTTQLDHLSKALHHFLSTFDEEEEEEEMFPIEIEQDNAIPRRRNSSESIQLEQQQDAVTDIMQHEENMEEVRELLAQKTEISEADREELLSELERDHTALAEKLEQERHRAQDELKARMAERRVRARSTRVKRRGSTKDLWKTQQEQVQSLQVAQEMERQVELSRLEVVAQAEAALEDAKLSRKVLKTELAAVNEGTEEAVSALAKEELASIQKKFDEVYKKELQEEEEACRADTKKMDEEFSDSRAQVRIGRDDERVNGLLAELQGTEMNEKRQVEEALLVEESKQSELKRVFREKVMKITSECKDKNEVSNRLSSLREEHEVQVTNLLDDIKRKREKAYEKLAKKIEVKRKAALNSLVSSLKESKEENEDEVDQDIRVIEKEFQVDQQSLERALEVELAKRNASEEEKRLKFEQREAKIAKMEAESLVRAAAELKGKDAEAEVSKLREHNDASLKKVQVETSKKRAKQRKALEARRAQRKAAAEKVLAEKQKQEEAELAARQKDEEENVQVDEIVSNLVGGEGEGRGEDESNSAEEARIQQEHEEKIKALLKKQEEAQAQIERELAEAKTKMEAEKNRLREEEKMRFEDMQARQNEELLNTQVNAKTLESIKSDHKRNFTEMHAVKRKKKQEQREKLLKKLEARKSKLKNVQEAEVIKEKLQMEVQRTKVRSVEMSKKEQEALSSLANSIDDIPQVKLTEAVKLIFQQRHSEEMMTLTESHHQRHRNLAKRLLAVAFEEKRRTKVELMQRGVKPDHEDFKALDNKFQSRQAVVEEESVAQLKDNHAAEVGDLVGKQGREVENATSKVMEAREKRSRNDKKPPRWSGGGSSRENRQEIAILTTTHQEGLNQLATLHQGKLKREQEVIEERFDKRLKLLLREQESIQDRMLSKGDENKSQLLQQFEQDKQRIVAALRSEKDAQFQRLVLRLKRIRSRARQDMELAYYSKLKGLEQAVDPLRRRFSRQLSVPRGIGASVSQVDNSAIERRLSKIEQALQKLATSSATSSGSSRSIEALEPSLKARVMSYESLSSDDLSKALIDLQTNPEFAIEIETQDRSSMLQANLESHLSHLDETQRDTESKLAALNAKVSSVTQEANAEGDDTGQLKQVVDDATHERARMRRKLELIEEQISKKKEQLRSFKEREKDVQSLLYKAKLESINENK